MRVFHGRIGDSHISHGDCDRDGFTGSVMGLGFSGS